MHIIHSLINKCTLFIPSNVVFFFFFRNILVVVLLFHQNDNSNNKKTQFSGLTESFLPNKFQLFSGDDF